MATEYGSRLRTARKLAGLTQTDLGTKTGIPQSTISTAEREGHGSSETPVYAKALGVDPHWLATGEGEMLAVAPNAQDGGRLVKAFHPEDALPDGAVVIPESKVAFSAGSGHSVTYELAEEGEPVIYQLSWFRKMRINPKDVRRFKVKDDSAEPLAYEGDSILVNHAETDVVDGKVYAFRYGDDLRVKKLFKRLDGTLILRSINTAYKDEEVPPQLVAEHITVIGRVRDKSGPGGL